MNNPPSTRASPFAPREVVAALGMMICALWVAYLLLQTGHIWDESEHAHAAWLMSRGQRPLDDFFQHHQPLLWDLLSIYYRLGFGGAEVLIWGRLMVALSGLGCLWALLVIACESRSDRLCAGGITGAFAFIAMTLLLPDLFVSRPESVSLALMLVGLAFWCRGEQIPAPAMFIVGALVGAACYASPRFLAFGGFFLFFGSHTPRRWLLLVAGCASFLLLYTVISGFSVEKVIFNLKFSAYLQTIGDYPPGRGADYWNLLAAAVITPMVLMLALLGKSDRLRGALSIAYLLLVYVACHKAAGMFTYVQAYAPFLGGVPLTAGWLVARRAAGFRKSLTIASCAVALLVAAGSIAGLSLTVPRFELLQFVREKNELAAMVPVGRTVMLFTIKHPITIADASYYGTPLFDGQDRLCRAVRGFDDASLPACDYFRDLQSIRPYLVDSWIDLAVRSDEASTLKTWLLDNYKRIQFRQGESPLLGQGILVERAAE